MRDLIRDNNMLLMTLSRFGIAFGFAEGTVEQVCRDNQVDLSTFLAVCNLIGGGEHHSERVSVHALIEYLRRAHSSFLDVTLPRIRHHLIDAIDHSAGSEVAMLLMRFFDDYVAEVKRHLDHENDVVFEYVESLLRGERSEGYSISCFSVNHSHMTSKLKELKDIIICHYTLQDNARLSASLFDIINCEKDLMYHFEIEANLFVPAVEELERLHGSAQAEDIPASSPHAVDALGEREKDIIRCVVRGMSNKEIADALCLSIHTVTTHRRNISAKLDIHSTAGLTVFAIINHLVDLGDLKPQ